MLIVLNDFRRHTIPNKMVLLALIIQIITVTISEVGRDSFDIMSDIGKRLFTIFLIFLFLYFFFVIGALGAGDVKLLLIVAAGFSSPLIYVLATFLLAGIQSIFQMIRNKILLARIKKLLLYCVRLSRTGTVENYTPRELDATDKKEYSIHLSLPVMLCWMIYEGYLLLSTI